MKMKLLVGGLLFLIVVNLATIGSYLYVRWTQSQPVPHFGPGRGFPMDLDPLKRARFLELLKSFRDETQTLEDKIVRTQDEIFSLLGRDSAPQDKVKEKLKELADLRLQISERATQRLIEAKSFLSPVEQKMFLDGILQMRPEPPRPFGHEGPPPPPFGREEEPPPPH